MTIGGVLLTAAVIGMATVAPAPVASARSAPTQREIEQHACYNDAMSLCGEFVPDEARITACMVEKKAQLSPPCAAMFKPDAR